MFHQILFVPLKISSKGFIWGIIKNSSSVKPVSSLNSLIAHFISFSKFKNLSKEKNYYDLLNIDGIGEIQVSSIKSFFANETNVKVLDELGKILIIKNTTISQENGLLKNKSFLDWKKL